MTIAQNKGCQSAFVDNLRNWDFLSHFPAILDDKKRTDHLFYLVMTPEKDPPRLSKDMIRALLTIFLAVHELTLDDLIF